MRSILVAAAAALAACGDGPTVGGEEPPPPGASPAFTAAVLTAGGEGVVTGTALDRLPATITVDGRSVTLASRTPTEARFAMPAGLPCEVDGRPIRIESGSASITQPLKVATTVSMQLGESRVLDPAQAGCVQLPGGGSEYVLTALHPGQARVSGFLVDTFFTVNTITGEPATTTAAASLAPMGPPAISTAHDLRAPRRARSAAPSAYSDNPIPFDPRYATAGVGERVRFVEWDSAATIHNICSLPRSQVPAYETEIIAVSGKTVIAIDVRAPHWAVYTTPEARAYFHKVAAIVDPVVIPAMRAVFDPAFEPLKGGGGRHYMILTPISSVAAGTIDGGTWDSQAACAASSEMVAVFGRADAGWKPPQQEGRAASGDASTYVHEYGHVVDEVMQSRTGLLAPHNWFVEPFAVQAEETAARIGIAKLTGVSEEEVWGKAPTAADLLFDGVWGKRAHWSPYIWTLSTNQLGNYAQGASMVLFARERIGDIGDGRVKSLYLRLLEGGKWDFAALAAQAGMSPDEFHTAWMLAYATDDLTAENSGLPRFATWNNASLAPILGQRALARRNIMAAGVGNFTALHFLNRFADWRSRGTSFQIESITGKRSTVRLTRIR